MTKSEMDAAIKAAHVAAFGDDSFPVTPAARAAFLSGMRAAGKIADGEYLEEELSEESVNAYDRAVADVIGAINRTADELSG